MSAPTTRCGWRAATLARVETGRELRVRRHQHVGVREQVVEPLDVARRGEVEHDAALARVAHRERERHAVAHRRELARGRTAGRLDLHDVGAEVAEEAGGQLAALDGAVDDAQTGQGQGRSLIGGISPHLAPVAHCGWCQCEWSSSAAVRVSVGAGCSGSGAPFTVCWIQLTTRRCCRSGSP